LKPTILTVANQKGGVAKTTTSVNLAHGLALKGKEVLLIDVDPQGQCASALGLEQEAGVFNLLVTGKPLRDVVRTTGRKDLFLLPGNKRTSTAQSVLSMEASGKVDLLLSLLLENFRSGSPDYIVVDTAPSVGGLQEMALWAADSVLIPTATDGLATEGVVEVVATLESLRTQRDWQGRVLGILPTFYDEVTRESKVVMDDLREALGDTLILDPVHRATVLRECAAHGRTIFEYAATSRAAEEYAALVWKILDYE
jgi:chromosome partitioning protein